MPALDGTGPRGLGPMTGRRMGRCADQQAGLGKGYGRGFGRGYGAGYGRANYGTNQTNQSALEQRIKDLENTISVLRDKIETLLNKKE